MLLVSHSTKSPGSENVLPSGNTVSIVNPQTVLKALPFPKIRPSLRLAANPVSVPIPPSPNLPSSSLPGSPSRIGPDDLAHVSGAVQAAPVAIGPSPPSPKKKRLADGRAKPVASSEGEKEPLTRATLFGTRVKGEHMSLDVIIVHGASSSQVGTSVARRSTNTKNTIQPSVARRPRADHDMSVDDIRVKEISSDDDEPSSSQVTLVSERVTRRTATRRKDPGIPSSQETVVQVPQRSRAAVSTGAKKPLTGGIVKSKRARPLPKDTRPLSSSGATVVLGALTIDS
jgi:hypothetical protein